jgi:hypothetical protein
VKRPDSVRAARPVVIAGALACLLLGAAPPAAPPGPSGPPSLGITASDAGGARRVEAVLPGRLIAATLPRGTDGRRRLVLLVAPEEAPEGPRAVYRLDLPRAEGGGGALVPLARGLAATSHSLDALDLDGDGGQEVLLGEPGEIRSLGSPDADLSGSQPRVLADRPGLDLRAQPGGRPLAPPAGRTGLEIAEPGKLRLWTPAPGGAPRLKITAAYDLPLRAAREAAGLRLLSPPVHALRRAGGAAPPLYLVGPEAAGRRLRSVLLDPGNAARGEAWSRLPGAEEASATWYVLLDGRPALLAAAVSADRVAILERQRLRLFQLAGDRTRAGALPSLAVPTSSRRWQPIEPLVTDWEGDGRDDLLVFQMDGLRDGELVAELFAGLGNGRLQAKPRRQQLGGGVKAEFWVYGEDWTGDRLPDLLVVAERKLLLFAGAARGRQSGRTLFEARPRRTVPLGAAVEDRSVQVELGSEGLGVDALAEGAPRLADLDGDGRSEILFLSRSQRGRGVVRVVWLP